MSKGAALVWRDDAVEIGWCPDTLLYKEASVESRCYMKKNMSEDATVYRKKDVNRFCCRKRKLSRNVALKYDLSLETLL